ncbi:MULTISPECIES: helix-turn-helix transcriptional regulator [unclassified Nocardiopsis]|uniref:helix-turn-helix domain-containing protein n=1 Tax=unclassified Nocardiopsis TaxID=2649073 RepID=UPI001357F1A0|nr:MULTISPECIES: helix-turn-helix transcriptional regulator [unclassified Nocardiopsis]
MSEARFPEQLLKARELAGLTQRQLAARAGTSSASVCRWEGGISTPKRDNVQLLDEATSARGRLLRAWSDDRESQGIPAYMRDLGRLEEMARTIELVSPHLIPGLLQSPGYARLVFEDGLMGDPPKELDRLVALRCRRYEQLRKMNDPRIVAVFPETALAFAPEAVRKEQVRHLLGMIDAGKVRLNLVPQGSLLWGTVSMLLVFHMENGEAVVSSDHVDGNVIYEDSAGYTRLQGLVKQALGAALPAGQSRMVLEKLQ